MDLAAHQCVVDPSAKQLHGKKAYAIMAANDFGTRMWWGYEKRQRDVGSTTREYERVSTTTPGSGSPYIRHPNDAYTSAICSQ